MNELALFAGAGGGILGGKLLGWRTICAVEIEPYAASVLVARQNDGILPPFPIWDDIRTFDGKPWRGRVDVISGGFPCQDISTAGKGKGIDGERSGLWREMARVVCEVRPRFAFVENSPALTSRGLGVVLGDLAAMGYDARWGVLGATEIGAPHKRERIWIVANASCGRRNKSKGREVQFERRAETFCTSEDLANCHCLRELQPQRGEQEQRGRAGDCGEELANPLRERQPGPWQHWFSSDPAEIEEGQTDHAFDERLNRIWGIESRVGRVANGVANRMDRLEALGNGQASGVAKLAFETLS